jgi:hypothetical protein
MTTVLICSANRQALFADDKRKICWLPSDASSPWNYCRHCTFTQKNLLQEEVVRNLLAGQMEIEMPTGKKEKIFEVVRYPWFKDHCAHPASKVRLYHILLLLKTYQQQIYHEYLQNPRFISTFVTLIQTHRPSQGNILSCKLICDLAGSDLHRIPRQCPFCLYELLKRNRESREYYTAFTNYIRDYAYRQYVFPFPNTIMKEFIRMSIKKGDVNREYAFTAMQHYYRLQNPATVDQRFYEFLQDFLLEDSDTFGALIQNDTVILNKYRPGWMEEFQFQLYVIEPARHQWKQLMKARCDTYKEDLMIKTCHPRRLFKWIFDIEELKDFDLNDRDLYDLSYLE